MNNIPKYQGGGYLERLMGANIGDIQSSAAEKLAESQRKTKKKEGGFRSFTNLLKGGFKFIDPTGGILGGILDTVVDPIGRGLGYGGKATDIKLDEDYQIFGGKEALETARGGFEDSLSDYRQSSLMNALLGFGGSKVGGALLDKMPKGKWDWLGVGGDNILPADTTNLNIGDIIKNPNPLDTRNIKITATGAGSSQGGWWDKLFGKSNVGRSGGRGYEQGGMVQKYEDGGIVQEYQEGGQIQRMIPAKKDSEGNVTEAAYPVWDTYSYDETGYTKTATGLKTNPNLQTVTISQMEKYRSAERQETVGASYMETTSEIGLNEFLRTPAVAEQLRQARAGNEGALSNLIEMLRQQRPELANKTNKQLRKALSKILPEIDLYGEDYQETLAGGETTLEGLVGEAQKIRGQVATQEATSGIRTPGSEDTISEGLYTGAEDVYAGMQKDIQTGFEKEFDPLASAFVNPSLG